MGMDYIKTTGAGDKPLTNAQTVAMEETKFFPTDVLVPLLLLAVVAYFQLVEASQTSVLGLLVAAPLTAAIFGKPRTVSLIATISLFETAWFCVVEDAEMNNGESLLFLAVLVFALLAITTANIRVQKDKQLAQALMEINELEMLERVASTDWLTGELNRRGVALALSNSQYKYQSVVMFDIDGLKKVNDAFGHLVGDDYVKNITARIASNFKASDIFGRWGGDEFIAILPLEELRAVEVVNRVIEEVHRTAIESDGIEIEARVSAGVAPWPEGTELDEILGLADQALYGAKAAGGSRAVSYSDYREETASLHN